jgi:CHAT domain-containing protein
MDEEVRGIFGLINFFLENEQQSFRMQKVLLSKHTTKQALGSINWSEYNFIHIILHGLSDGRLALENPDKTRYKDPDFMTVTEFLDILKGKNLDLIFLSFCFSGGGLDGEQENLAVQLTKNDASQYVIAYGNPVGDSSAASFAKIFYEYLINGSEIEQVYKTSLQKYYQLSSTGKYVPLLYTCNQGT